MGRRTQTRREGHDPVARAELRMHVKDCAEFRKGLERRFETATLERQQMHRENSAAIAKTQSKIDDLEGLIRADKTETGKRENKFLRWIIGSMLTGMAIMAWYIVTHIKI